MWGADLGIIGAQRCDVNCHLCTIMNICDVMCQYVTWLVSLIGQPEYRSLADLRGKHFAADPVDSNFDVIRNKMMVDAGVPESDTRATTSNSANPDKGRPGTIALRSLKSTLTGNSASLSGLTAMGGDGCAGSRAMT